ncbi:MAG: hypothetical protein B1H04_06780 [Planctomycetales bacterium 4484_123]|nr:MAG: hypothetical protein B1H04_06780 [Planctomycetales bacterium 4484_123]
MIVGCGLCGNAAGGLERSIGARYRPNRPVVWKIPLPDRAPAKVFFGHPARAGKDKRRLSDPQGLAADGRGHLAVSDGYIYAADALNHGVVRMKMAYAAQAECRLP